jgi:hypothetical protein
MRPDCRSADVGARIGYLFSCCPPRLGKDRNQSSTSDRKYLTEDPILMKGQFFFKSLS